MCPGVQDNPLLYAGKTGVADLHTQIPTGHHHPIAGHDQFIERIIIDNRFGAFYLGNNPGLAACRFKQVPRFFDIAALARE